MRDEFLEAARRDAADDLGKPGKDDLWGEGRVNASAYAAHPERFVRRPPVPAVPPEAVWINPPKPKPSTQEPQA